jgi:hypothetical protein
LGKLAQGEIFKNTEAASIVGYVALVKPGGRETCNCKAKDAAHKDTHIALVTSPAYANDESKYVVVEVTPRTRRRYHFPSTATLQKQILHKRVLVTGWLFYDAMHTAMRRTRIRMARKSGAQPAKRSTLSAGLKYFISDSRRERADYSWPLDGQPPICSIEQHACGAPSRCTGATHCGDT